MADAPGVATSPRIDPDRYRDVMGRFVTGITVVTTMAEEDGQVRPFGTTVNAFNSVSLDPPLVLITIGVERSIHPVIARTGRFAVNILAEDGQDLSDCFSGAPSLHPRTAFCDAAYRVSEHGMPVLDEALAWIDCQLDRTIEAGISDMESESFVPGMSDMEPDLFRLGLERIGLLGLLAQIPDSFTTSGARSVHKDANTLPCCVDCCHGCLELLSINLVPDAVKSDDIEISSFSIGIFHYVSISFVIPFTMLILYSASFVFGILQDARNHPHGQYRRGGSGGEYALGQ